MKVIVTGSNGFIGSRVCALLAEFGVDVVYHVKSAAYADELLREATAPEPVDCIVCCAGDARKFWAEQNISAALDRTVGAAQQAVQLALRFQAPSLVLLSSVDAYYGGKAPSVYASCKHQAEAVVLAAKLPGRTVIIRASNVWGEGSKKGPIHDLLAAAQKVDELRWRDVWAAPDASYDFVHVDDVARAVLRGVDHLPSSTYYAVGEDHSVRAVARALFCSDVTLAELRFHPEIPVPRHVWHEDKRNKPHADLEAFGWCPTESLLEQDSDGVWIPSQALLDAVYSFGK